ncbi:class F sortase [Geodermatophilus sp. URMC 64]
MIRRAGWAGAVLAVTGLVLFLLGLHVATTARPQTPVAAGAPGPTAERVPAAAAPRPERPGPPPVHLDIPRIGVHTDVIPLGLNPDGTVSLPPLDTRAPAGWYRYLAAPGDPGPAVLLGHVDTYRGPAVFYRLGELQPGDTVSVQRADGRAVEFRVDAVRAYPKSDFPAQAVYGPADRPVLRLVTCGGAFDRDRRSYLSNVVVYASLVPRATDMPGGRAQ